jgi:uncharacterized protein YbaP (TraB family)
MEFETRFHELPEGGVRNTSHYYHREGIMICFKQRIRFVSNVVIASLIILTINAASAAVDVMHPQTQKNFLWHVKGEHASGYILGSVHVMKRDSYPLPSAIEHIDNCCGTVVFETDIDDMDNPVLQARMIKLAKYPPGQMLSQKLSPQTYSLLKEKVRAASLSMAQFEAFKPWFIALTLATMEFQRIGFDPNFGIDRYFFDRVRKANKKMIFLETNDFQMNVMAKMGRRMQEGFLKTTLQELNIIEAMASDMLNAWRTGDADTLHSIIALSFQEHPDIYNRLFVKRNKRWILRIKELMRGSEDFLVIVGAGHLVGRDSVIDLLQQLGYEVRQM